MTQNITHIATRDGEALIDYAALNSVGSSAIGKYAVASGEETIAGCRGYYYNAVYFSTTNKTVTFCLCKEQVANSTEVEVLTSLNNIDGTDRPNCEWATSVVINEETGDTSPLHVSYANDDKQYNFEFEIDAQKPYLVTIKSKDGKIPFSSIRTLSAEDMTKDDFAIFSAEQPLIGAASLKQASFATGSSVATGTTAFASGTACAYGDMSHAEGWGAIAYHHGAHAEGRGTLALGNSSHTEGHATEAHSHYTHAEGDYSIAKGNASHAEGVNTRTNALGAHAEGGSVSNIADTFEWSDDVSHEGYIASGESQTGIEGSSNYTHVRTLKNANANYSHTEGYNTSALGSSAHAEGYGSIARAYYAHAEGQYTQANKTASHAEGYNTLANGDYSHAEGKGTQALAKLSHAEGESTKAYSYWSHAEGRKTIAGNATTESYGRGAHAEGISTQATGTAAHAEGNETKATATYAHAEGVYSLASGNAAHAEGGRASSSKTKITWTDDVSFGDLAYKPTTDSIVETVNTSNNTKTDHNRDLVGAKGAHSHTEGLDTSAAGDRSHAEGQETITWGKASHAEGHRTQTVGEAAHAEGYNTLAKGYTAHTEGKGTIASGNYSHAEGEGTKATAYYAHAEGRGCKAAGSASHAGGLYTKATAEAQTAIGKYNATNSSALFIVGNGTGDSDAKRSNAFEVISTIWGVSIKIGSTTLTEAKLIKLINLIDTIE